VPKDAGNAYAEALEPFVESVAWTALEDAVVAQITGFAPHLPDLEAIERAMRATAQATGTLVPKASVAREQIRDWLADNIRQFPPINAGRFFIYGSDFEGVVPMAKMGLRVPAGRAFGTGDHGSTMGCLLGIDALRQAPSGTALDMGCGSAVLALAIAKKWRTPVLAADIDPVAVATARENIEKNRARDLVRAIIAPGYRHREIGSRQFGLIAANILARPLCRMAGDLARHLAPGGAAILSGLLTEDAPRVAAAHRGFGLNMERRIEVNGWTTLVLRKSHKRRLF